MHVGSLSIILLTYVSSCIHLMIEAQEERRLKICCNNNEWKEMLGDFYDLVDCQLARQQPGGQLLSSVYYALFG